MRCGLCSHHFSLATGFLCRSNSLYEKYFIIQRTDDKSFNESSLSFDDASIDFDGTALRGFPLAGSARKFSFCALPGIYRIHTIDANGDGWWRGAYSVVVNGATVIQDEMGRTSSLTQSTTFNATLPLRANTTLSGNKAPLGGGGGVFWEDTPPQNIETYRKAHGSSNSAKYGNDVATPARTLLATSGSYTTVSGGRMTNTIDVEVKDRQEK